MFNTRAHDPLVPAQENLRIGLHPARFLRVARSDIKRLSRIAGLTKQSKILDIGCGSGKIASGLLSLWPDFNGTYTGFDVQQDRIAWAKANLGRLHKGFRFFQEDIYNSWSNGTGAIKPETFSFPFEGEVFDVALLHSVITHMTRCGAERFLAETARVLKPGGRLSVTCFLLNVQQFNHLDPARWSFRFDKEEDGYAVDDADYPDKIVAYDENLLRALFTEYGFRIVRSYYGIWRTSDGGWEKRDQFYPIISDIMKLLKLESDQIQDYFILEKTV